MMMLMASRGRDWPWTVAFLHHDRGRRTGNEAAGTHSPTSGGFNVEGPLGHLRRGPLV